MADPLEMRQRATLSSAIPSDELQHLRKLLSVLPQLREIFGDLLEIRLVIDAEVAQRELRWRLGKRRNSAARTALHEAIDSGTIVAFAPQFLEEEIQEHIGEIAEDTKVPVSSAQDEWQKFKSHLHFYDPEPSNRPRPACVDPDDLAYKLVCEQLGARAVYSKDPHFQDMSVPVISVELDLAIRKYARASSVKLTISLGATFSMMIGFGALVGLLQACMQILKRLPTSLKLILGAAAILAVLHPKSRAKIVGLFQSVLSKFDNLKPALANALNDLLTEAATADTTAKNTYAEIQSLLPPKGKPTALMRARAICLLSKEALLLREIKKRMLNEGYVTNSRNFTAYLRRELRKDKRFVEVSADHWTIRAVRLAECD
jgi:hypothetical protein